MITDPSIYNILIGEHDERACSYSAMEIIREDVLSGLQIRRGGWKDGWDGMY